MTSFALDETLVAAAQSALMADPWLQGLSVFTATWVIGIVPVVLIGVWLRGGTSGRQCAITATLSAIVALTIAGAVSFLFYVPRPFAVGLAPNLLDHVADSSFPSDHVAVMAAVAVSLLFARQRSLGVLVAFATLAVGATRVVLGVHYPSDILAATLLGTAVSVAFRASPVAEFSIFCRHLAEALYAGLGLQAAATRIHLEKNRKFTR